MLQALQAFLDYIKEINWAISLFASLPLSIAANLFTPLIQRWLSSRSAVRAKHRIDDLQTKLHIIKVRTQNRELLQLETNIVLLRVLVYLGLGIVASSLVPILGAAIGMVFIASAFFDAEKHMLLIRRVMQYDGYKASLDSEIARLQQFLTKRRKR